MTKAIPAAVLEQHAAILGKTGRGKTNTAKVCVEQAFDQDFRVCILDTIKSDWWGLTSSSNGRLPGLPFTILGGPYAHLPLASSSGRAIADQVANGKLLRHCILDMADFEPGGQMVFFSQFAPRLLQRMRGVLYLVIEEAHLIAPKERAGMGYENMSIHWAKMLATAGRKKGIRLIVISQRTQALHNAVLGSCDSMIVHGMTAPADMEPVVKWLKANSKDKDLNATIEGSLSNLSKGKAWVCSGEARLFEERKFALARTYDNTRTPEDDAEVAKVERYFPTSTDLFIIDQAIGQSVDEAADDDPKVLRLRIDALKSELSQLRAAAGGTPADVTKAQESGFKNGRAHARNTARDQLSSILGKVDTLRADVSSFYLAYNADRLQEPVEMSGKPSNGNTLLTSAEVSEALGIRDDGDSAITFFDQRLARKGTKRATPELPYITTKDDVEGVTVRKVPTGLRARILSSLSWLEQRGMRPAARAALGGIADFTPDRGYGARTLAEMLREGLLYYPVPGYVELSSEGRVLAPEPPTFATMLEAWQSRLSGLHREVIDALSKAHPTPLRREELGEMLSKQLERGYGARVLGELKTMGAIEYPLPGSLRLTKHVVP